MKLSPGKSRRSWCQHVLCWRQMYMLTRGVSLSTLALASLLLFSCSPAPEPTTKKSPLPPVEGPGMATNKHPLAKYIEVAGIRLTESGVGKLKITFAVINHSPADIG